MKYLWKCFIASVLILTLVFSGTLTAFGAEENGIQVQYNGQNIALSDAAQNINGRIMLPFRSILEALGADVSYNSRTKTVLAKTADKEISFTVGGADIIILENGVKTTKKMDVAAFLDKKVNRTYVPVRSIAQSMGYNVGWDALKETVVIIDPASIFANADADFSIISKLLKSGIDPERAYALKGQFDIDVTNYTAPELILPGMNFSVSGKMTGIRQKNSADMEMNLAFRFDQMLSKLPPEERAQIEPLLKIFSNTGMKIKMDGETGDTYINSDFFSATGPAAGENTWYKMNSYDTYTDMGIDLKTVSSMEYSGTKLSEILEVYLSAKQDTDSFTYQDIKYTYSLLKDLIGDDAFSKKTSGGYVTYSLNLNTASVYAAYAKLILSEGIPANAQDMTSLRDVLDDINPNADIVIREKAGMLVYYSLKGGISLEEIILSFDMTGGQTYVDGKFSIDQKDSLKLMVDFDYRISETSETPDLSLPPDAVVMEYPAYNMQ